MKGMQGGMQNLIRQANQLQTKMKKLQEELEAKEYQGQAGGAAVKVTVTGKNSVKEVLLSDELVQSADKDMIQDLITAAVNDALKLAHETSQKEMEKLTGGMPIPGLF